MKQKLMAVLAAATLTAGPALADLKIVDTSYRTGPYAANGIPFSDGYQDYFTLLNERDGGIGGEKINLVECETGYNTEKGVECYEGNKGGEALVLPGLRHMALAEDPDAVNAPVRAFLDRVLTQ